MTHGDKITKIVKKLLSKLTQLKSEVQSNDISHDIEHDLGSMGKLEQLELDHAHDPQYGDFHD